MTINKYKNEIDILEKSSLSNTSAYLLVFKKKNNNLLFMYDYVIRMAVRPALLDPDPRTQINHSIFLSFN